MLLACFQFRGLISWKLTSDDKLLFALPKTSEWFLVSPLLYPQLSLSRHDDYFHALGQGKYFVTTPEIVLATKNDRTISTFNSQEQFEELEHIVKDLLVRLRHLGGQATIPKFESCSVIGSINIDDLPAFEAAGHGPPSHFQRYLWTSAITADQINAAAAFAADFVPPAHEVLFLDAVVAHRESDYRSSILYSAISAEVAFGFVIDREYERVITGQRDARFRMIERHRGGGGSIYKDPIYERLRRRPDFNTLINELALYVLGKSLLVENEELYLKAKRLYSTRNELAHSGGLNERGTNEMLPLDLNGSLVALETSVALFSWLGERADFPLPKIGFVPPLD